MNPWRWWSSTTACRPWPTRSLSPTQGGSTSQMRTRSPATLSGPPSSRTPPAASGSDQRSSGSHISQAWFIKRNFWIGTGGENREIRWIPLTRAQKVWLHWVFSSMERNLLLLSEILSLALSNNKTNFQLLPLSDCPKVIKSKVNILDAEICLKKWKYCLLLEGKSGQTLGTIVKTVGRLFASDDTCDREGTQSLERLVLLRYQLLLGTGFTFIGLDMCCCWPGVRFKFSGNWWYGKCCVCPRVCEICGKSVCKRIFGWFVLWLYENIKQCITCSKVRTFDLM